MKLKKAFLFNIAIAALVASLVFFLSQKGLLKRLELPSVDLSFRLRGDLPYNPRIIFVEITDYDISKIGAWPWKRSWHAALSKALAGLGAKYIYFDIIFSEASAEEDDALLEEAIKLTKNVYLPVVFQDYPFDIKTALLPIKRFASYTKGMGAINIYPDIDGTIRRIPLLFPTKEGIYPHAAFKIALDYAGLKIEDIKSNYILLSDSKTKVKVPLIEKNTMLINWSGKWQDTFKHYTFLEVLSGYKDFLEHKKINIDLGDFKDSICIIGITAIGLYDIKPIPLQPEYPGIGIIANTISNILDKNFLYRPSNWINIFLLWILALIPAFLMFGEKPLRETLFVVLVGVIYFYINFFLFKKGITIDLSPPLVGLFASYISVETYNFVRVAIEKQRFFRMAITDGLTGLFNIRYFKMLIETETLMAASDPTKQFVIVMSDVDHFKHFNDTYGHQVGDLVLKEVANILKTSVRSSDIAARYGGEEMIILLRGSSLRDGLSVAEKIRKNVEEHSVKQENNAYKVTISLGVSIFKPNDNVDTIIKRADEGLYKAKESGRNRVCTMEEPTGN